MTPEEVQKYLHETTPGPRQTSAADTQNAHAIVMMYHGKGDKHLTLERTIAQALTHARAEERARCAAVADAHGDRVTQDMTSTMLNDQAEEIANAIRALAP